jgi:outer membrane receptor protein involved in Fe transport
MPKKEKFTMHRTLRAAACALICAAPLLAQTEVPKQNEVIEVTATKIAEDVMTVPAHVTVIDGDDLRARNATDLASALATVAGVDIPLGGDQGPAGSIPEMWGLKEFDAFLLVVDNVPWGGAFNPDIPTLDLTDVDRIEILRGAAPVMYGATSFVGVIHVIHRAPGAPGMARASIGSYGSGSLAASMPLSQSKTVQQSILANIDRRQFRGDAGGFERAHVLYRAAAAAGAGTFHFDADGTLLRQDPNSPHPRVGLTLTPLVPVDANHNPSDAKVDQNRIHLVAGYDTKLGVTPWTTTLAVSHSKVDSIRGFLDAVSDTADPNSVGFRQNRNVTDVYFDTHIARTFSPALTLVAGFDHLFGRARANSRTFEYFASLNGGERDSSRKAIADDPGEAFLMRDRRNFSGLYAATQWMAAPKLRIDFGARLNRTSESRDAEDPDGSDSNSRDTTRLSGTLGAEYTFFESGRNLLAGFADYRNAFKPAAIDFGPEAEADILSPETANSYEVGVKGRLRDGKLSWTASMFQMDFRNLVVSSTVNGLPVLENAGSERFKGAEIEGDCAFGSATRVEAGYSYHDSRFVNYQNFGGNRLEVVPFNLASAGLTYAPATGFNANVIVHYVGARMLNKRNTAPAAAYTTWSAGAGYRIGRGELRLDAHNINNTRPPIAESELGEGQYYLLPARSVDVSYRYFF